MTGYELVDEFYFANLNYLNNHPHDGTIERASLILFLMGLIETIYIIDPTNIHPDIPSFLNAN